MSSPVIRVEALSKIYRIGAREKAPTSFREAVAGFFSSPIQRFRQLSGRGTTETFWALKDVSFDVQPGEVIGIIGRNGAGKSTLLKILSQITEPTAGRVVINGRIASLLEVGTGFHPELTGRENAFLNGAILGMSRTEIKHKFDQIVEFAGVEKFIDTPVKHYSSGMSVRLAFAVAAHLEPEILIIDEVLAVGDAEFQKKCLGKMRDASQGGRTVLFVSHNLPAVRALCSRALLLRQGVCEYDGSVSHVLDKYSRGAHHGGDRWIRPESGGLTCLMFSEIELELHGKQPQLVLSIILRMLETATHSPAFVAIDILDSSGVVIMQALPRTSGFIDTNGVGHKVRVIVELPPLIPGSYTLNAWVGPSHTETYDSVESPVSFCVEDSPTGLRTFPHAIDHGWIVPASQVEELSL